MRNMTVTKCFHNTIRNIIVPLILVNKRFPSAPDAKIHHRQPFRSDQNLRGHRNARGIHTKKEKPEKYASSTDYNITLTTITTTTET